ncbi:unnamed protein product, partial [Mesorhabditis belari]|uniref:Peptidoglycan binding-like domain-containing protein n=1 Tax=Mesorhabditis belari TaxID=2138241 RepID=A0AAF3F9H4_9BILA
MLFYLFFVFLFSYTFGAPVASENSLSQTVTLGITTKSRLKREWNGNDSIKYLHQFGYLPPANLMTAGYGAPEMDTAQEKLREAIRRFQRIADIPETGVIDEATKEKMAKPRCGVPDVAALSYGKASIKWHKRELTWSIDDYSPDLSKEIIRKATKEAFNFWSQVAPLDFREVITDADIKNM